MPGTLSCEQIGIHVFMSARLDNLHPLIPTDINIKQYQLIIILKYYFIHYWTIIFHPALIWHCHALYLSVLMAAFPGRPGSADTRVSSLWILLKQDDDGCGEWWQLELRDVQSFSQIVTIDKPTSSLLQTRCPSCCPTNSVKAPKENITFHGLTYPKLTWGLPTLSLTTNSSWLPWGGLPCLSSALWCQYPLLIITLIMCKSAIMHHNRIHYP